MLKIGVKICSLLCKILDEFNDFALKALKCNFRYLEEISKSFFLTVCISSAKSVTSFVSMCVVVYYECYVLVKTV